MAEELTNYIEDDWNDNSLTNRSAKEKGLYYSYSEGGTGDLLKGVYRPKWKVMRGSPTVTSGELVIQSGDYPYIQTQSKITTGSWSYDWRDLNQSAENLYTDFFFFF